MTLIEASGAQFLTLLDLIKLSSSTNVMTRLVLQDKSLIAVITSVAQCSGTFESSYDASSSEARITNTCKELVFCGLLHGAAETTYRRYVRVERLMRRYPGALGLAEKVSGETTASNGPAESGGFGIADLDSSLLLHFRKQNALLLIEAAADYTETNTRDKRSTALLNPCDFYSYAARLLKNLKSVHKKPFYPANRHLRSFCLLTCLRGRPSRVL